MVDSFISRFHQPVLKERRERPASCPVLEQSNPGTEAQSKDSRCDFRRLRGLVRLRIEEGHQGHGWRVRPRSNPMRVAKLSPPRLDARPKTSVRPGWIREIRV